MELVVEIGLVALTWVSIIPWTTHSIPNLLHLWATHDRGYDSRRKPMVIRNYVQMRIEKGHRRESATKQGKREWLTEISSETEALPLGLVGKWKLHNVFN